MRDLERGGEDSDGSLFAGQREGSPLSNMALMIMLRGMKQGRHHRPTDFARPLATGASELSSFSGEAPRTAPAHQIQNEVERAYPSGDALEKRRGMMETWPNQYKSTAAVEGWLIGQQKIRGKEYDAGMPNLSQAQTAIIRNIYRQIYRS